MRRVDMSGTVYSEDDCVRECVQPAPLCSTRLGLHVLRPLGACFFPETVLSGSNKTGVQRF